MTNRPEEWHWYFWFTEELDAATAEHYINQNRLFRNFNANRNYYDMGQRAFTQIDINNFTSLTRHGTPGNGTRRDGETTGQLVRGPITDIDQVQSLNHLTWGRP